MATDNEGILTRVEEMATRYEQSIANQRQIINGMLWKLQKIEHLAREALKTGDARSAVPGDDLWPTSIALQQIIDIKVNSARLEEDRDSAGG